MQGNFGAVQASGKWLMGNGRRDVQAGVREVQVDNVMELEETLLILRVVRISLTVPGKTDAERIALALEWVRDVSAELEQVVSESAGV